MYNTVKIYHNIFTHLQRVGLPHSALQRLPCPYLFLLHRITGLVDYPSSGSRMLYASVLFIGDSLVYNAEDRKTASTP